MTIVDINKHDYRTRVFKGFAQFQDPDTPANYLRLKERQTLSTTFSFSRAPHYNDSGRKVLDPSGYTHNFSLTIKLTADMFEDVTTGAPTDKSTISYWIYKNAIYEPVELLFVTTFEAVSEVTSTVGDKYVHLKFKLDPSTFGPITSNNNNGTNEMTITGEIIEIMTATKETSSAAPADPTTVWHT